MPDIQLAYYVGATLLMFGASVAWITNFFALPGNWFIVGLAALFAWAVMPINGGAGITWQTVGLLAVIAGGGEVLEMVAGAYGAAKQGASRRGVALALIGTLAGSITGAIIGFPVPVVGPILGAVAGGAAGAFAGAYLGEMWKHGSSDRSVSVGWGALIGRLLGTVGKLAVGAVIVVVLAIRAFA